MRIRDQAIKAAGGATSHGTYKAIAKNSANAAADIYEGTLMAIHIILENYELLNDDDKLTAVNSVRKIIEEGVLDAG